MDNEKVIHVDKQFIFESGSINTIINGGTFNGNVYTSPQKNGDAPNDEAGDEPQRDKADGLAKDDFDAQAVLDYVAQLNTGNREMDGKCAEFWRKLIDRYGELTHESYAREETCFKAARCENPKDFSRKFVCCVIGYLKNTTSAYGMKNEDVCAKLGENSEQDSARMKNIRTCLRDYSMGVERVVKEVAKEIFG